MKLNKYTKKCSATLNMGFVCCNFITGSHTRELHQAWQGLLARSIIDDHSILLMSGLPAIFVLTQHGKLPLPVYLSDSERVKYMRRTDSGGATKKSKI